MGYTTEFSGKLNLSRNATVDESMYINSFSYTRRMSRNPDVLYRIFNGKYGRIAQLEQQLTPTLYKHAKALNKAGIKLDMSTVPDNRTAIEIYGEQGQYFAHPTGEDNTGVIDYNQPPGQITLADYHKELDANKKLIAEGKCQPSLWCNWTLTADSKHLHWNGQEKFYYFIEWLQYLITNFFQPWGIKLNGQIKWSGEDHTDVGIITVKNNIVTTKKGKIVYQD